MLEFIVTMPSHIVPFMSIMGQVVTIWGFLNFMNQLNLQNITIVADRALGRLPGLKNQIFTLQRDQAAQPDQIEDTLENINEIMKRLYMDLKQLGIAQDYTMLERINLLSADYEDVAEKRKAYLVYECGSDCNLNSSASSAIKISFIQKLENQLLNIFDLSHQGPTFTNHLSTNVVYISWISFVIYLIECHYVEMALSLFAVGVIGYFIVRWKK